MKKWAHQLLFVRDTAKNSIVLYEDGYIHHVRQELPQLMMEAFEEENLSLKGAEWVIAPEDFMKLINQYGDSFHLAGLQFYLEQLLGDKP